MIRSMTGFGEAEQAVEGGRLRVEIKTVNHRFLNTSIRTPPGFDRIEHEIQQWIRPFLSRGHASISVSVEREESAREDELPVVDRERAEHYVGELRSVREDLGLSGDVAISDLLRFNDVFRTPEPRNNRPSAVPVELLRPIVEAAARGVVEMRVAEGSRLREDLEGRVAAMRTVLGEVEERAPVRLVEERERLRAAIRELAGNEDVDEDRLARELAYLAERWDINEEVVRFRSHLDHFAETMDGESAEPVGKRLSFLIQEMHREANTIGSKANDTAIAQAAIALKEEIERLREQVENVE